MRSEAAAVAQEAKTPRLDMEHTNLVAGDAGGGVLRKASAADVDAGDDTGQLAPSQDASVETSHEQGPPADLSLLVNQLYAQIKRELMIERERKGGIY